MYYKELNLPPIPQHLLLEEFLPQTGTDDIGYGKQHFKNGEMISPCSYWFSSIKNKDLLSWLWSNVPVTKMLSSMMFQETHHSTGGYHIVHSDILRTYALNYMIDLGGEDVWITWYKEKDQPLSRTKKLGQGQSDSGFVPYENLEILEQAKFKKEKWYIIATNILHDVGKIKGTRKSLTISIPPHLEKRSFEILGLT
jgi:hypothetical protein